MPHGLEKKRDLSHPGLRAPVIDDNEGLIVTGYRFEYRNDRRWIGLDVALIVARRSTRAGSCRSEGS